MPPSFARFPLSLLLIAALAGCGGEAPRSAARKPPPQVVETARAEQRELAQTLKAVGTLEAVRRVDIVTQEEGTLVHLPWFEGDAVAEGEILLRLDDAVIRAELDKARANRRQAELDLKRLQGLVPKRLASEDELARARTALALARAEEALLQTRLARTVVRAPFSGVITRRLREPGDALPRHTHVLSMVDPRRLRVRVAVSELVLPDLAAGQPVAVTIDALGGETHPGRIARVHPTVDPSTRKGLVDAVLDPVPGGARPGQLCRVTLRGTARPRLVVPFSAVRHDASGAYVFRIEDGTARRRPVRTGRVLETWMEVLDGLAPGDEVVTQGFLGLENGRPVRRAAASG